MADTRRDLPSYDGYRINKIFRAGASYKARVLRGRRGEELCIVKDVSCMKPVFRWMFGRRMLAREARALERLADFPGTPRLLERISRDSIAIERVMTKYKYLRSKIPPEVMPAVLDALERVVGELHARGFVHLDLRQRKNILVPTDDSVILIDFESARYLGTGFVGQKLLLPLFARIDRSAILKWRVKFTPDRVSEEDRNRVRRHLRWRKLWPWKAVGRYARRWIGNDQMRA